MRPLFLALAVVSCSSPKNEAPTTGVVARYDVPATGAIAWSAIPFPNDLHLGSDGTVDLATLPRDAHDEPVWQATLGLLDRRKGFCATCSVYFPVDGDVEVPGAIDAPSASDPIVFVDLEEKKLLPVRARYRTDERLVAVRPRPGTVLLRKRAYAVALTTALRGSDGQPLRAAPGMTSARATTVLSPAFDALAALGIARDRIASVTRFTVDDVASDVLAARTIARAAAKPVVTVDKVWKADQLDALMGVPEEKLVGRRKATDGPYGALHESIALVLAGRFAAPRVITGKGTDIGAPLRDEQGALRAGEPQDVNFLLTIPKGGDVAKAPVVLVHTGLTGTMSNGLLLAESLSRAGAVVVSVEPALHGARATSAKDARNTLRDVDGPDGLMEHDNTDVGGRFVGFVGFEPNKKAWPGYVLGVGTQQMADAFAAFRLLEEGDWSAVRGSDPSLVTLAFDKSKLGYFGLSNGSIVGTKIAIAEPNVAAIALNVPPASLGETLFMTPGFRQIASISLAPNLAIPLPENADETRFDPLFDMYRWTLEPVDPLALSPYIARAPLIEGARPDILLQHAGHDELVGPMLADQFAAVAGFPGIGSYTGAEVPAGTLPMWANFTINGQTITAGSVRFDGAMHTMVGYVEEDSSWETVVSPYRARPTKVTITNPTPAVQKQLQIFFASRFTEGRARIAAD